ncbi:hypothetical protein Pmani_016039 [Petrolisthes manimaculis]|uniref:Chitin-binding type-2 domain-containing protein n=1 Tax=Petrolisthes manimaculis TaxID=1843537 RepID=A0AAE1UB10_9EUCA|nr:hypothetical protein Pmani_016039 [Petrolisthes manimaculis]
MERVFVGGWGWGWGESYRRRRTSLPPLSIYKDDHDLHQHQFTPSHQSINMKVLAAVLCLVAVASARMAYQFADGYLDIIGAEPAQTFECVGRPYGYYADVATDCRVFHVCVPISDEEGTVLGTDHYSFFCGNQTVFSQESLTCSHPQDAFPCDQAETLYDLSNADFGKIPEENLSGNTV